MGREPTTDAEWRRLLERFESAARNTGPFATQREWLRFYKVKRELYELLSVPLPDFSSARQGRQP